MATLRDRVQALTATVGAGPVTLGAATPGHRTFVSTFSANATVSYVITDGTDWETGTGLYSVAGNSLTRNLDASSTGALLNLSGSAVVSVAYLSRDHVPDWPFVQATLQNGGVAMPQYGFTTIPTDTIVTDTHGGFTTGAQGQYVVPQAGVYDIMLVIRVADNTVGASGFGAGVHTLNGDGPWFRWFGTNYVVRNTSHYRRISAFAAGAVLKPFFYGDIAMTIVSADLAIIRVR